jgi:hypothetical protein
MGNQDEDVLVPFFPSRGGTLDGIGIFVDVDPATAVNAQLAIYEATSETDLTPGSLVVDSGPISLNGVAVAVAFNPINVVLDRTKLYWLAVNFDNFDGTAGLGAISSVFGPPIFGTDQAVFQGRNCIVRARPFGSFPNPYPAVGPGDLAEGQCWVMVRYSA